MRGGEVREPLEASLGPSSANGYVAPNSTTSAPISRAAASTRAPTSRVGHRDRSGWRNTRYPAPSSKAAAPSQSGQNTDTRSVGQLSHQRFERSLDAAHAGRVIVRHEQGAGDVHSADILPE